MALLIMGVAIVLLLIAILLWDGMDVRRQQRELQAQEDAGKRPDDPRHF